MRRAVLVVAVSVLGAGPWLGLVSSTAQMVAADPPPPSRPRPQPIVASQPILDAQPAAQRSFAAQVARCICNQIVVDLDNEVRDAEIETGDVEVTNRSLTYVAPGYEDDEVEVEQEAIAISGDAIAGQIAGVVAPDGCTDILVRARNLVEDAKVRSGDASARNQSTVLFDPAARRGDVDVEVEQRAEARSGIALAGQILGILNAGGGGDCGNVSVEASNDVRDAEVESGEASFENESDILTCQADRCRRELMLKLAFVDSVQVCDGGECTVMTKDEFVRWLRSQPEGTPAPVDVEDEEPEETKGPVRYEDIRDARPTPPVPPRVASSTAREAK